MKAYLLSLGAALQPGFPALLTALSCGAARQTPEGVWLRVLPSPSPDDLTDRLLADLDFCHRFFAGKEEFAFFRTRWQHQVWSPTLPSREALVTDEESRLLLRALRGEGVPFSFRTDREAVEWSLSTLLEGLEDAAEGAGVDEIRPFLSLLDSIQADLDAEEDVRIVLLCDLSENYAAGLALGLLRFLRSRFSDRAPFLGLVGLVTAPGEEGAAASKDLLSALRDRSLVRISDERDTEGADACWLLSLPVSLRGGEGALRLLCWAAARIIGRIWTDPSRPGSGIHTLDMPFTLTLHSLDQEARPAAAFLRGAVWCLSDLFPALRAWLDHPTLIRSLGPATRGGLFRRLLREEADLAGARSALSQLERTMRVLLLEILQLIRTLPAPLREAEPVSALWQQAIQACGRAVTLASEVDVRRQEAEDAGVDKVQPVHRVSLADTVEEQMIHRLDQMDADLNSLLSQRSDIFHQAGGYLACMALEDCLSKCQVARVSAREKLALMPSDTPEQRTALALQERRVRLLEAAIRRCEQDLAAARDWKTLSSPGTMKPSSPFSGEILDPALAEAAFTLLTGEGESAQHAADTLREGLGNLLHGYPLNDAKMLLRNLQSVCRTPDPDAPLRSLMAGVFSVCGVEVSGLRLQGAGQLPALPLLPDLCGQDRFFSLVSAPDRVLAPASEDQTARNRGILALLILRQYRRRDSGDAALEIMPLSSAASPLVRVYLSSRGVKSGFLCALRKGEGEEVRRLPLCVLLPGRGLEPARLQAENLDLVPSFVYWLDREAHVFRDPCVYFSAFDRQVLTAQLTRLRSALTSPEAGHLSDFLGDWLGAVTTPPAEEEDSALDSRLRVACGLCRLPLWKKDLRRVSVFYEAESGQDPVCGALSGSDSFPSADCPLREEILYAFRGTPLARENEKKLLESAHAPEEATWLSSLDTECDILLHSSDDYHEALAAGLRQLLSRYPAADPDAVRAAEAMLKKAEEPITDRVTELTWPWDIRSTSVLTILTECLGQELAPSALNAFSDRLALFPARGGEILGDVLLSGMCTLRRDDEPEEGASSPSPGDEAAEIGNPPAPAQAPSSAPEFFSDPSSPEPQFSPEAPSPAGSAAEIRPDAVLPPLSPDFARSLCRGARGQSLLQPGFLSFRMEGNCVRTEMTLEGAFTLKLIRTYGPQEIQSFYAHLLPTLALWPSLPFAEEDWHAYVSYAHCAPEFSFTAVTRDGEVELTGPAPRLSALQTRFPLCYLVFWEGKSIGAVPNLLPPPQIPESRAPWCACVDFGASGTSVVFTDGISRWPMQGPVTVRTLLRSPASTQGLLWREFLPAVPVSSLLPGALRLFRQDLTQEDFPLREGAILMSSSLYDVLDVPAEALYTDLKWNGEKGRGAGLYLHQAMLMAALQARCGGAVSLCWRFALPEDMPAVGRERLAEIFRQLAARVSGESGLPLPDKLPPVAFASESTALGSYFRLCSPDQARGGFMTLDIGADTADLSLFLQGREEAVRTCQLPLGFHHMLLPALLRRPQLLLEDFGFVEDPAFQQSLAAFQELLLRAAREPSALRQARYALDALLCDHLPLFLDASLRRRAAQEPGRSGALFLLHTGFLMMASGLLLLGISGDPIRNDFLPESMTLFLAGRGSILIEALSPPAKTSLWKLLTMFRNARVSSLNLLFSAEKKLEIPVGLSVLDRPDAAPPHPPAEPAALVIRPEELMPEFLLRFRREFPAEAALLFPGMYANDYYSPFTPYGAQLIGQALQAAFDRRGMTSPFPALAAFLDHLLQMIQEAPPPERTMPQEEREYPWPSNT